MKFFKRNNIYFGILLALITPVVSYLLLMLLNYGLESWFNQGEEVIKQKTLLMSSVFLNLFIYIPYIKSAKYERTGTGVLLVTFIGVVLLFLFVFL
ncbi:MAG: hypothetical protein R6V49_06880 [Bacteroidales bacterium]